MKTGDTVTDGSGRAFTIGDLLGRGRIGSTWAAKDTSGREWALKLPWSPGELGDVATPEATYQACREALLEQAQVLRKAAWPFLPRLEDVPSLTIGAQKDVPALLMPRYPNSWKRRLSHGVGLVDTLELVRRITAALSQAGAIHGNLRPSNVLFTERGDLVLTDAHTPAIDAWVRRLEGLVPDREPWLPPEADGRPRAATDTWALTALLWRTSSAQPGPRDPRREERVVLPREGLDKVALAGLKDRALAHLREERANPRFAPRLADRLSVLVDRGLSLNVEPSPPYRFHDLGEYAKRLAEIAALADPRILSVGQLLLANDAKGGTFEGGTLAAFSVTIGIDTAVHPEDDVQIGVQIFDLDATDDDGRVRLPELAVKVKTHPSGRHRYDFTAPGLAPGRYRATVMFRIKDAAGDPAQTAGEFEVRPPPGYVPPSDDAVAAPTPLVLPINRGRSEASNGRADASAGATVFPLPIAPTASHRNQPEDTDETPLPTPIVPPPFAPLRPALVEFESTDAESERPSVPSLSQPSPPLIAFVPPPIAFVPPPRAPEAPTRPTLAPEVDAPRRPDAGRAVDWDDARDAHGDDYLPGRSAGSDLPTFGTEDGPRRRGAISELIEQAIELVRRDAWTAFVIVIAGIVVMLVVLFSLVRYFV